MAQSVLKLEKLSHIMGPRGSLDLRSPSPIMAPSSAKISGKILVEQIFVPKFLLNAVALLTIDPPRIANLLSAGQHNLNYFVVRKTK